MNLRDHLASVVARDSRYSIEAYLFVLEALRRGRGQKLKELRKQREKGRPSRPGKRAGTSQEGQPEPEESGHVTGRELCLAARQLALRHYGSLAMRVLAEWGIGSTSDIGEIVYNMIASGDLDKTPCDKRSDFDGVFDFATALQPTTLPAGDPTS
ncbi:MAG TPA: Minf_1886 family protein [Isosphaeraceae bacterium]|nr:Minf_1886 family protein [Isosphaeraceae bacterium]